jgi:hypothetical protein
VIVASAGASRYGGARQPRSDLPPPPAS